MSTALELTGFLLGVASWLVTGAALANDYWKVSSFSGSVIISSRQYENLWHACAEDSSGVANCRDFDSLLDLPDERFLDNIMEDNFQCNRNVSEKPPQTGDYVCQRHIGCAFVNGCPLLTYLQACRALMIIALILGLFSMIVAILGLKCIQVGSSSDQTKAKKAVAGGVLFILAGLCTMTAISWYAARIVEDFKNPFSGGIKFELGAGLYMGWGGACLSILGGALLCCACKDASSGKTKGAYYARSQAGKIHKPVSESETARAYV